MEWHCHDFGCGTKGIFHPWKIPQDIEQYMWVDLQLRYTSTPYLKGKALAPLVYVSRAHEMKMCPLSTISNFIGCLPWAIHLNILHLNIFLIFEKKKPRFTIFHPFPIFPFSVNMGPYGSKNFKMLLCGGGGIFSVYRNLGTFDS